MSVWYNTFTINCSLYKSLGKQIEATIKVPQLLSCLLLESEVTTFTFAAAGRLCSVVKSWLKASLLSERQHTGSVFISLHIFMLWFFSLSEANTTHTSCFPPQCVVVSRNRKKRQQGAIIKAGKISLNPLWLPYHGTITLVVQVFHRLGNYNELLDTDSN